MRRYLGAHYHAALITNSRNSLCGGASRAIRNIRSIEFLAGSVNRQYVNVAANSLLRNELMSEAQLFKTPVHKT